MAEAAQLWLAIEYTGYIPEPASLPAASRDCGMDGWTGSLGITQPRTHRIGYLGVEQDLRERREHVGSREQLGEVEVEPSSEWVQSSLKIKVFALPKGQNKPIGLFKKFHCKVFTLHSKARVESEIVK